MVAPPPVDASTEDMEEAKKNGLKFMEHRAREVYEFIEDLVRRDRVPSANPADNTGGIVVGGWSCGGVWMQALLAFVDSFPVRDVDLSNYVRHVVCYGQTFPVTIIMARQTH